MAIALKNTRGYDVPDYKEIQLTATSSDSSSTILAEIAAYEAAHPCSIGSEAYSFDYAVYYRKKNDGTWASIL